MREARFADRVDAGGRLADRLSELHLSDPVVLGLPRGGVVVAAEVARSLGCGIDVFVARKVGHPHHPELGLGAIAEGGEPVYDTAALKRYGLTQTQMLPVVAGERAELLRRISAYRGGRPLPPIADRCVVLVDDGVATGVTARAAIRALRAAGPSRLVFAVPVGPASTCALLAQNGDADDVVVVSTPRHFTAVGQWYDDFAQVSDAEVLRLLPTD